jgi:hypothetical protein
MLGMRSSTDLVFEWKWEQKNSLQEETANGVPD